MIPSLTQHSLGHKCKQLATLPSRTREEQRISANAAEVSSVAVHFIYRLDQSSRFI